MSFPAFLRPHGALPVVTATRLRWLIACVWFLATAAGAREYSLAPVPGWVAPVAVPTVEAASDTAGGVRYLLVDHQTRHATQGTHHFTRYAILATSEQGIDEAATHEMDFDPTYQTLVLHTLAVTREGRRTSRLEGAEVRVLQREKELDKRIYDGRLSANIFVDDIRVGDTVEVAYSVRGSNPVFEGRHFGRFSLGWGAPVERQHARLLHPAARALRVVARNGAPEPTMRELGAEREYVWRRDHLEPLVIEEDAPGWFDPYPHAAWSEFADWNAVARWAAPLYAPAALGPALRAEVVKIRANATTDEARLLAALRLVQGELRYLGFEIGTGSHAPRAPDAVFARRFGDCKDKTLLLVSLLHALDIRARAALVSIDRTHGIARDLPNPAAFDHVIVRAELGGRHYWLDPTRPAQRAALDSLHQPDFGRALVVDPATQALVPMAREPARAVKRRFDVVIDATAGIGKPARMTVTTTYEGDNAEGTRGSTAARRADELQKDYLNYYANFYPGIRVAAPMTSADDLAANRLVVIEHYEIPVFWPRSEKDNRLEASVYSPEMDSIMRAPSSTTRVAPVALAAGVDVVQRTEVRLPETWEVEEETFRVEDPHFVYDGLIESEDGGKRLIITDRYRTLADHVPSGAVPAYAQKLAQARDRLGYTIYKYDDAPVAPFLERFNWTIAMIAVLLLAVFAWAARRLYKLDPAPRDTPPDPELIGLGGWLVLPAIALFVAPLRVLGETLTDIDVYAMPSWIALTHPGGDAYNALWAPLLLFALAGSLAQIVLFVLTATLFFRCRRSAPVAFIATLVTSTLLQAVMLAGTTLVTGESDQEASAQLALGFLSMVLWCTYFLVSRRVRSTFTRGWRDAMPPTRVDGHGVPPPRSEPTGTPASDPTVVVPAAESLSS